MHFIQALPWVVYACVCVGHRWDCRRGPNFLFFIWTKAVKISGLNSLETTVLLFSYFTAPISPDFFLYLSLILIFSLIFNSLLVLLHWNCIVYSSVCTLSLFCCSFVYVLGFSCFVSPPKPRNEFQYTEQEEISRITNLYFFGREFIEILKRMD